MNEDVQSMLLAPAGLYLPLLAGLTLAMMRSPRHDDLDARLNLVEVFLFGIAAQCVHTIEEFSTGFHLLFPPLLGLAPLSAEAFVGFNIFWLGIWALSANYILRGSRIAYFPVWFFGLAMCLNGIAHPLLALWVGGYFPGLVSSPLVGIMGVLVTAKLIRTTKWSR